MSDLRTLINQFDVDEAAFNAAAAYTDSVHGTAQAEPAWERQCAALEVLQADALAVCAYRTTDLVELSTKASFLMKWIGGMDSLQGDEARALLGSMIEEVQP